MDELPDKFSIPVELHRQQMLGQIQGVAERLDDPEQLKHFVYANLAHYKALVKT